MTVQVMSVVIVAVVSEPLEVQFGGTVPVQPTGISTLPVALALIETLAPTLNVNVPQT